MNVEGLAADLAALSDATKTTFQLINRLSKLNFQPGSAPLNEHGDVRLELAQDIRDNLKQHQDTLEALRQETDDVISSAASGAHRRRDSIKERERARIAAQVARLDEDLKQYVSPVPTTLATIPYDSRPNIETAHAASSARHN